jgi:hypothetical protein
LHLTNDEYEQSRSAHDGLWKEARYLLTYGASSEGYWNSEKFLKQVEQTVTIAEMKYPSITHNSVFLFDQSSGHTAYAADALNANRMNVNPGGTQPRMRDTVWNGKVQRMVENGVPKGMRTVLEERGVHVLGMKAEDMRKKLKDMHDFKYEKTKVEKYISGRGHRCIFIPQYHCELNPRERVWGHAKQYTRKDCDYSYPGLERTMGPALNSVPTDLIRKYFRRVREYARAYREGYKAGPEVERALNQYKSHRRASEIQS